jgi:signal transduction histidine kinase/phage shock protein PspC (stress-responsive transcriptional regulator)
MLGLGDRPEASSGVFRMDSAAVPVHAVAMSTPNVAATGNLSGADGLLLGVAAGTAGFLRLDAAVVRLAFIGTALAAPPLALAYPLAYPFVRGRTVRPWHGLAGADSRSASGTVGVLILELCVVLGARSLGWTLPDPVVVTLLAVQAALALGWRRLDQPDRFGWLLGAAGGRSVRLGRLAVSADTVRVLVGLAAMLVAVDLIASRAIPWALINQLQRALWPFELLALGLAVVVVPRLLRVGSQFAAERRERIRADERADLAAHLHDSVLQTLILIQRHGGDPGGMAQLARRQERELREWLYGAVASRDAGRLRDRLTALAAEIEDRYQWRIELIVVGDGDVGQAEEALLAATREAIVNAARHSRAPLCDVYAECGAGTIQIFVRDRGVGFDYGAVATDRRGLTESVIARMDRVGGSAEIRSEPGAGTEISLRLPQDGGTSG